VRKFKLGAKKPVYGRKRKQKTKVKRNNRWKKKKTQKVELPLQGFGVVLFKR